MPPYRPLAHVAQPHRRVRRGGARPAARQPRNWRVHPKAQQDALAGALDAVGWVGQVLVNRRTGFVVDGHARVALALSRGEPSVPVLYVDLEPAEEALVLATLDPIGAMAERDDAKLRELLADVRVDDDALLALFGDLAGREPKAGLTDPTRSPSRPTSPRQAGRAVRAWATTACCAATRRAPPTSPGCSATAGRGSWSPTRPTGRAHMEWRDDLMAAKAPAEASYMRSAY